MRNEACRPPLLAVLLLATSVARAEPGSWFAASPCSVEAMQIVHMPGSRALFSVHDQPDVPPHDVLVDMGEDGHWRITAEEWAQWTPKPPPQLEAGADGVQRVPLRPLPSLALRVDECTGELWVDADPERLQRSDLNRPPPHAAARAGYGGFLNLDAGYGGLAGPRVAMSVFDVGAFGPGGSGRSGFFVGTQQAVRRLDSTWLHDEPDSAVRLRLGDGITRNADWESAVRFGGVQWGTDFSLQPDRITFPLPAIAGRAALASTAQLYVNGVQQSQQPVQPGQFRFESVPALTGAGELSVVIRDSLGREQTVTQPFYASPRLLTKGLVADTYEAGFLREDYAASNDRYTRPFAATTLQRGYTDTLTGLARGAVSQQRQLAGAEGDLIVSPFGVFTLSAAASHTESGWGGIGTIGFERQANNVSVSLRRRFATRSYGDLGREPGTLHFSDTARVSLNLHRGGNASAVYVSEQPWKTGPGTGAAGTGASGVRLAGLAWNVQAARGVTAYASWLHPLSGDGGDSIVVGLSLLLGPGTSAGAQWVRDGSSEGSSVSVQHVPPGPLGWSYAASADGRDNGIRQAQAALAGEHGTVGAGFVQFRGQSTPSAVMRTGFAFLDGHGYWTRPVQNSFAVIDTGQASGVRVYRENQLVGTTDSQGRLLVPDLLPFSVNRLSIDDSDLPAALGLNASTEQIAPPSTAGVPVHFTVDARPSQRLRLLDPNDDAVPAGAALRLDGRPLALPVGYDGLMYADIPNGRHVLEAIWAQGRCVMALQVTAEVATVDRCAHVTP